MGRKRQNVSQLCAMCALMKHKLILSSKEAYILGEDINKIFNSLEAVIMPVDPSGASSRSTLIDQNKQNVIANL